MKFIHSLTDTEKQALQQTKSQSPNRRMRDRAQAVLWSHEGYKMSEIAKLLSVHRVTVSSWLTRWETEGLSGLSDQDREGRPLIYTEQEQQRFIELVESDPRQLRQAQARLEEETGKLSSRWTLKRLLKKRATAGKGAANR